MQKIYKPRNAPFDKSTDIDCILIYNLFEFLKFFLINMITILMMLAKLATVALLILVIQKQNFII